MTRLAKRRRFGWGRLLAGVTALPIVLVLAVGHGPRHDMDAAFANRAMSLVIKQAAAQVKDEVTAPAIAGGKAKDQQAVEAPKEGTPKEFSLFGMMMSALAGLVLFIYGVTQLAQGLTELNTDRMRGVMSKFTTNRSAGIGTGIAATTLLESSSVTIIMVIAMVSGGVLTFVQSLAVVLGANIGTTVGSQIIALDVEQYIPLLMLSGLLLMFIGKSPTRHKLGIIVLGFGMMFYGLEAIDDAMKPLRHNETFIEAMRRLGETPLYGALVGAVFTIVVQSSSATVAIVITLAGSGMISLPAGVAIMLGAEIGTCADTLLATIGRGRPALRTGVFHLLFNLVCASIGVLLAPQLISVVQSVSGAANVGRQIASAQILFNVIGVVVVVPFLPAVARALERLIPDANSRGGPKRGPVPAE